MSNETRSNRNGKHNCEEEVSRDTNRNQSIPEGQEETNNTTDNGETTDTKDTDRTLLQNRQEQSNSESRNMGKVKIDIGFGRQIRCASDGVLRERSRIRDDSESLRQQENKSNSSNIRYFSMFTGVGGFELGFERANALSKTAWNESRGNEENSGSIKSELLASKQFTCIGQSEFNKYSSQVLKYRFPNIKNWGDCTKIKPEDLPDFDMLCGGFPCQAFSIAGKRRGFEDIRGTMFFEVARILKIKRPKTILLENVKGLLNHDKGKTFRVILQTLDELGYEVQWMVLNSKFHGVPQNRERVLIIGNIRGTSRSEILPFGESDEEDDGIYEMQQANDPKFSSYRYYKKEGICPGLRTMQGGNLQPKIYDDYNQKMRNDENFGSITQNIGRKAERNGQKIVERFPLRFPTRNQKNIEGDYSFTVDASNTGGVREGYSIRRLTPIECCRLQGFPDDWNEYGINEKGERVKMSDAQRYKQMGNAVTTKVIAAIGSQFLNSTSKEVKDDEN